MGKKKTSNFSPEQQLIDLDARLLLSLQRLSDMLKAMQWEQARLLGITPLQLQILLFVGHHTTAITKVAYIATELQLSRPTISDATATLVAKGLMEIEEDRRDRRSYSLLVTDTGRVLLKQAERYTTNLDLLLQRKSEGEKTQLYQSLYTLISGLSENEKGGMQRTCFNCEYYDGNKKRQHSCQLLKRELPSSELQIDCMYHSSLL